MLEKLEARLDQRMESLENQLSGLAMCDILPLSGNRVDNGLPTGWAAHKDEKSGQIYFQNDHLGRVQWKLPHEMRSLFEDL